MRGKEKLTVLDQAKAYDTFSKANLRRLCGRKLPHGLSTQISALVVRKDLKTLRKLSKTTELATVVVSQRDPSARLSSDYTSTYFFVSSAWYEKSEGNISIDDIIFSAAKLAALQRLLDKEAKKADWQILASARRKWSWSGQSIIIHLPTCSYRWVKRSTSVVALKNRREQHRKLGSKLRKSSNFRSIL